ncbi:MAG: hypothetical protein II240_07535 [Bacteroidaceae bacterium]|nr:hypothetical protein [Bacteroidaceae bacterium]
MSNDEWKKENTTRFTIRLMNSSGMPEALKALEEKTGVTRGSYTIAALREALIRDGYLTEKSEE